MSAKWTAPVGCPDHLRAPLERAVNAYPEEHLDTPATGEVFKDVDEAEQRLLAFSLSQGFDIVKGRSEVNGSSPFATFQCIFHGKTTRNTRKLEEHVVIDQESGLITSHRKREATSVRRGGCEWCCKVSYKSVGRRGSGEKGWVLTIKSLEHSHPLSSNPLEFPRQRARLEEFQAALAQARAHRTAVIPYSVSRRVLESSDYGVILTAREYYNSVRHQAASKSDDKTIIGLIEALRNQDCVYEVRAKDVLDDSGGITSRKCQQIWFSHPDLLKVTARFVAGSLCIIDATFNTNNLRMPMIVAVGVMNNEKTFPIAFSFCPGESTESYSFFWESLKLHLPKDTAPPGVVISDQAGAILSSIERLLPGTSHQICTWHAAEAMCAAFAKFHHTQAQIRGKTTTDGTVLEEGLKHKAWAYIDAHDEEDLEKKRSDLIKSILKPSYVDETWRGKEDRIIEYLTRDKPNLGHRASQAGESYHKVLKGITHGQLSLEQAVSRLCRTIRSIIQAMTVSETFVSFAREAQGPVFYHLRFAVTPQALRKVAIEWSVLCEIMKSNNTDLGVCNCKLLKQFLLPCRHYLKRAYETGEPLPRTLLHPRWWLNGPPITSLKWVPRYPDEGVTRQLEPLAMTTNKRRIEQLRDTLNDDERIRFDRQHSRLMEKAEEEVIVLGERRRQLQDIPINDPDALPKRTWKKPKEHGKANERALTANELAASTERQQTRVARQEERYQQAVQAAAAAARPVTPEAVKVVTQAPTTPSNSLSGYALAYRTPTAITETPEKIPRARPRRSPSPDASPTSTEASPQAAFAIPTSTAPAGLGTKRMRKKTEKQAYAQEMGWLHDSQGQLRKDRGKGK
jgi:hypothetical protein